METFRIQTKRWLGHFIVINFSWNQYCYLSNYIILKYSVRFKIYIFKISNEKSEAMGKILSWGCMVKPYGKKFLKISQFLKQVEPTSFSHKSIIELNTSSSYYREQCLIINPFNTDWNLPSIVLSWVIYNYREQCLIKCRSKYIHFLTFRFEYSYIGTCI